MKTQRVSGCIADLNIKIALYFYRIILSTTADSFCCCCFYRENLRPPKFNFAKWKPRVC